MAIELIEQANGRWRLRISATRRRIEVWQERRQQPLDLGWLDKWGEWKAIECSRGTPPLWAEKALAPLRQRADERYPSPPIATWRPGPSVDIYLAASLAWQQVTYG